MPLAIFLPTWCGARRSIMSSCSARQQVRVCERPAYLCPTVFDFGSSLRKVSKSRALLAEGRENAQKRRPVVICMSATALPASKARTKRSNFIFPCSPSRSTWSASAVGVSFGYPTPTHAQRVRRCVVTCEPVKPDQPIWSPCWKCWTRSSAFASLLQHGQRRARRHWRRAHLNMDGRRTRDLSAALTVAIVKVCGEDAGTCGEPSRSARAF